MASPLSNRLRADLFAQLATLEKAGLPADRAWAVVALPGPALARLELARKRLARGDTPATAGLRAGLFVPFEASLVRAALQAGSPESAYRRLAESNAMKADRQRAVRSGMVFPTVLLLAALLIQPLPQLASGTLTPLRYLAGVLVPLLLAGAAGLFLVRALATAGVQRRLLRLPLFGQALVRGNARDFFHSLALLLEAGIPMLEALPVAVSTMGSSVMRREFGTLHAQVRSGCTLAQALRTLPRTGPAQVVEWVHTGEESGTLPEMLERHARLESDALSLFWKQAADWLPRLAYGLVAGWIALGLLSGNGLTGHMPGR